MAEVIRAPTEVFLDSSTSTAERFHLLTADIRSFLITLTIALPWKRNV